MTRELVVSLNTLAGTLTAAGAPRYPAPQAAAIWAGVGKPYPELVDSLNRLAGNTLPNYKDLAGVCNQLASTTGLEAQDALDRLAGGADMFVQSLQAYVATSEGTASATYTDLTTPGPAVTVTVTATGKLRVIIGAVMNNGGAANDGARMSVALSGANTVAAASAPLFLGQQNAASGTNQTAGSAVVEFTGLTAGSTTVTCKYLATTGGTANFTDRQLSVDVYA